MKYIASHLVSFVAMSKADSLGEGIKGEVRVLEVS